jgi:hypothetical protein
MNETDTITVVLKISPLSFPDFELQTILQNDGFITFTLPSWVGTNNTNYWIGLKHRNGLETWSKTLVPFSMITMYDFSSAAEQAFGDNLVEVESGVWALYSGDLNQDGAIDAFDFLLMDPEIVNGSTGYFSSDLNGDGAVDAFDYLILDPNVIGGIGAAIP